jgi:hypothetical protein
VNDFIPFSIVRANIGARHNAFQQTAYFWERATLSRHAGHGLPNGATMWCWPALCSLRNACAGREAASLCRPCKRPLGLKTACGAHWDTRFFGEPTPRQGFQPAMTVNAACGPQ